MMHTHGRDLPTASGMSGEDATKTILSFSFLSMMLT
jgi:hypothetical protein